MQIGVIGTRYSALSFIDKLPLDDVGVHLSLKDNSADMDYLLILIDQTNVSEIIENLTSIWDNHKDNLIVCCLDDIAYDAFSAAPDTLYTWWTITVDQALELIKLRVKPIVNSQDLQV
jgi:hypothetical protein